MLENLRAALEAQTQNLFTEVEFPLMFSYYPLKNHQEFEFFLIAKKTSKSDFFAISCKRQGIITL